MENIRKVEQSALTIGCVVASAVLLIMFMVTTSWGQSYPDKVIRLVIAYAAGGGGDVVGRIVTKHFTDRLGQPMIIENRPGAGGNVGIEYVAKSKPDGYTLLLATPTITHAPSVYKKLNYDPIKELTPISLTNMMDYVFLVRHGFPANNLKECVEYIKANPGKVNYGSAGMASAGHLAYELFKSVAGLDLVHVTYKGGGPSLIAIMRGEVDMITLGVPAAWAQLQTGKLRVFATLGRQRSSLLPNVTTAIEQGVDNFIVEGWNGILAPGGTPQHIVNRLSAEWATIAAMPEAKEQMLKAGFEPISQTPDQFAEFIKRETAKWEKVTKKANFYRTLD